MEGFSSIFKEVDAFYLSESDSIFLLCSIKTSANPNEINIKEPQIVEISAVLCDLSDCRVFGEYSTKLVKLNDSFFFDERYSIDYNCLDKEDLSEGYTYPDILRLLYKKIWFSAYQMPKALKIITLDQDSVQPLFFTLFENSHDVVNRNLLHSSIDDIKSLDILAKFNLFLATMGVSVSHYEDLLELFSLDLDLNTFNEVLLLAGFLHLAKVYEMCELAEHSQDMIVHNLKSLKGLVSLEIKQVSSEVSQYVLPDAIL